MDSHPDVGGSAIVGSGQEPLLLPDLRLRTRNPSPIWLGSSGPRWKLPASTAVESSGLHLHGHRKNGLDEAVAPPS